MHWIDSNPCVRLSKIHIARRQRAANRCINSDRSSGKSPTARLEAVTLDLSPPTMQGAAVQCLSLAVFAGLRCTSDEIMDVKASLLAAFPVFRPMRFVR
jgi:hypothetical protein